MPLPSSWRNAGMRDSDTRSVQFTNAVAVPVGRPGEYLDRPGFWHGAMGVAACWLGGARAVAAPLYRAVGADSRNGADDVHAHAHLGAVDAALAAAEAMLVSAAYYVDAEPRSDRAELIARRVRAVVEHAVDEAIIRTGRALGPAPLVLDAEHANASPTSPSTSARVTPSGTSPRWDGWRPDEGGRVRNGARFAAEPVAAGGTPTSTWLGWQREFPELDLAECPGLVVVGPHPDDETLGFGATAAALRARGVDVHVVSVSDGGGA